jgi:hypothetical protein
MVESAPLLASVGSNRAEHRSILDSKQSKRSRQREKGRGRQTIRALAVLKKLYPEGWPTTEEISNLDLLAQFRAKLACVEAEMVPRPRPPEPSDDTVLRAVGRRM